jgi:3-dehydroquinate synthetase
VEAVAGYAGLLHGECVAIGMTAAAVLAVRLGMLTPADAERQCRLLEAYGLPVRLLPDQDPEAVLSAMRWDKKAQEGEPRFVLARRIGAVEFGCVVPPETIAAALAELQTS